MFLNRITSRAREILLNVGKYSQVSAGEVLTNIIKSEGMGTVLLQNVVKLKLDKKKSINPKNLLKEAYYQSIILQHTYVGTEHLLVALLKLSESKDTETVKTELKKINVFPGPSSFETAKRTPLKVFNGEEDVSTIDREEYNLLISVLLQKNNPNPLLVGDPGVGKKSLIKLLVKNINSLNVPPLLFGYQIIEFD